MNTINFQLTRKVMPPSIGTAGSAGIDFYVPETFKQVKLLHGDSELIASGVRAIIPSGFALIAFNKSGVSTKNKLAVGACVVDSDYTGEIHLHVYNYSSEATVITAGMKLVQFILIPYLKPVINIVDNIDTLDLGNRNLTRGVKGFGSTDFKYTSEQVEHMLNIAKNNCLDEIDPVEQEPKPKPKRAPRKTKIT